MRGNVSLTVRLATLFALLTAVFLVLVGAVMSRAIEHHFRQLDHHELSGKLNLIHNLVRHTTSVDGLETLPGRLADAFVGHDGMGVLVRDSAGREIYSGRPGYFPAAQLAGQRLPDGDTIWHKDGHQYIGREAVLKLPLSQAPPAELRILIGLDTSHHMVFLQQLKHRLWIGVGFAVILAALIGWFAAHKGLAPLRAMTATAQSLSAEQLGQRLAEGDAPSEVLELVRAFNGMLHRLELAFQRLAAFSADIAHELRTPVSNLMTQTQVALSRSRSAEDYREILASNLEEYERIARMVSDMLFLAHAENGRLPRPVEVVALEDEVRALMDFYDALADENGVRISLSGAATVTGDRLMLRRAVSNLLSNALRHTQAGGVVELSIDRSESGAVSLSVGNPGNEIPADQLTRIFERFHRGSSERNRHGEGSGLGLSITRSIAELHGGKLSVRSVDGWTSFRIEFPRPDKGPDHTLAQAGTPVRAMT